MITKSYLDNVMQITATVDRASVENFFLERRIKIPSVPFKWQDLNFVSAWRMPLARMYCNTMKFGVVLAMLWGVSANIPVNPYLHILVDSTSRSTAPIWITMQFY